MKRTYSIPTLLLFITLCVIELYALYMDWDQVHTWVKPVLIPVLLIYFVKSKSIISLSTTIMIMALIFSWAGDVFLLLENQGSSMFLFGLASFLIAHIFYIFVFQRLSQKTRPSPLRFPLAILLIVFGALLVFLLWPGLGNMEIPVMLYAAVIVIMGISAVFRQGPGSQLVLLGAFSFIASDAILAYNKFFVSIEYSSIAIMGTYLLAQFLIVQGILSYLNQSETA